ncbi:TRAP transporter small permease [Proteiniclasticum sp. SCR006]|uniref:TRAP transporter small permease n=1 Tax=Proteiniclasticum aestuarii TaxID=2817862 RepID=A0A939KJT7_9CLOT|nr:TRAP transporter small permease [Proteiniclasticum aestuarii]MBO1264030.1 TRAP transporter small permease [Proteiniclasticum aestuarii]
MKKIIDRTFHYIESLCKILLIVQIISVTIVVIGRQVFGRTPVWGEELTLFSMVWASLLGATVLLKNDGHIAVTALDQYLPDKAIKFLDLLSYLFLGFYAVIMVIYGIKLVELTGLNMMPALKIKSSWLYGAMPVMAVAMLVILSEKIYLLLKGKDYKL